MNWWLCCLRTESHSESRGHNARDSAQPESSMPLLLGGQDTEPSHLCDNVGSLTTNTFFTFSYMASFKVIEAITWFLAISMLMKLETMSGISSLAVVGRLQHILVRGQPKHLYTRNWFIRNQLVTQNWFNMNRTMSAGGKGSVLDHQAGDKHCMLQMSTDLILQASWLSLPQSWNYRLGPLCLAPVKLLRSETLSHPPLQLLLTLTT